MDAAELVIHARRALRDAVAQLDKTPPALAAVHEILGACSTVLIEATKVGG